MSRKSSSFFFNVICWAVIIGCGFFIASKLGINPTNLIRKENYVAAPSGDLFDGYKSLTETEKSYYDAIVKACENGKLSVELKDVSLDCFEEEIERTMYVFKRDHPEYFWINGGYSYIRPSRVFNDVNLTLSTYDFWDYIIDSKKYTDELDAEIEKVIGLANRYETNYEKAIFVHDYLVKTVIYDHDALADAQKTSHNPKSEYIYTAYGALVNKKAVCSGYAKAFQIVMHRLGINCDYVTGNAGGESHGWNTVLLDNEDYYIDVTWDDANLTDEKGNLTYPDGVEYEYFCVTTQQLEKTHTIDYSIINHPECTATKYDYFLYHGYYLEKYDRWNVAKIVAKQKDKQIVSVKFSSVSELEKAKEDLVDNNGIRSVSAFEKITGYVVNKEHCVLKLYKN